MHTTRTYLVGAGLLIAGFGLGWAMPSGNVEAQKAPDAPRPVAPTPKIKPKDIDKPKDPWAREDGLPSFAYQTFVGQKKYAGATGNPDTEILATQIPGLDIAASRQAFEELDFLGVATFIKGDPNFKHPSSAGVWFKDVEKLHFLRMDDLDAKVAKLVQDIHHDTNWFARFGAEDDNFWAENFADAVVLPPAERDGRVAEYTWEITRHANGRVKAVTPYIGETEKRQHGYQLEYNDAGNLIRMTPFVDGKRHGAERFFDGESRSRLQEAKSTKQWANGLPVIDKAVPKQPRAPLPPGK